MNHVLIDTSIWIDLFRTGKLIKEINNLVDTNRASTCALVKAEIYPYLSKNQATYLQIMNNLPYFEFDDEDWNELIYYKMKLIKNGENPSIPDLIIMTVALKNNLSILTKDKDFNRVQPILKFKFHQT